ncbi:MAG: hypothetical protein WC683_09645 [bacterium]
MRRQLIAGMTALVLLLFIWAVFTALIHGAEVEKLKTENESLGHQLAEAVEKLARLTAWMDEMGLPIEVELKKPPAVEDEGEPLTPEEASPASDFSVAGLTYSVPQQEPRVEIYLGWREKYPEGYANLISWGRMILRGDPLPDIFRPQGMDPAMAEASLIAHAGHEIDCYLMHYPRSPLNGYGREFALAGNKYGVSPYLLVALTAAESTFATDGSLSRINHNAWGMLGPNEFTKAAGIPIHNRGCWWPDWPTAIDGAAQFLNHFWPGAQTAHDCRGYCAGNPADWFRNVETVRKGMEG